MPQTRRRGSLTWFIPFVFIAATLVPMPASGSSSSTPDATALSQRPSPGAASTSYARIQGALARGTISSGRATVLLARAIYAPRTLPPPFRGPMGRDATLARIDLDEAIATLDGRPARVVERLVRTRAPGRHWCDSSTGTLPNERRTRHFVIWYDTIGGGLTIDQYAAVLEKVWKTEVDAFGWARPPSYTSKPTPGGRYPVRIASAGAGVYGYVSGSGAHAGLVGDNPATGWNEGDAKASCMVLNPGFASIGSANNLDDLKVTAAHEFLHSIQFGLGVIPLDNNYIEGAAAWIEDEVYDSINDNLQYLWPYPAESMGAYPTVNDAWYGYWLVWRGLTEQYGTTVPGGAEDVMQTVFENVSKGKKLLPATREAFWETEHVLFNYAFHQFAVALFFMKQCGGGYVAPYCFEEMSVYQVAKPAAWAPTGIVTKTQAYHGSIKDDYAMNWIQVPDSPKLYPIALQNQSADSPLFWSVACDKGNELDVEVWGTVEPLHRGIPWVHRKGCTGHSYVIVSSEHESAPNPANSPEADYEVWVPYIPMQGSVSWTVSGSASGANGDDTWSESWAESGTMTLALTRDPITYPDDILVDDGSTYSINYSRNRTEYSAAYDCTTTYDGSGSGSGPTVDIGFIGSTHPNLDPPDPNDDYGFQDLIYLSADTPLTFTDTWSGGCGGGSEQTAETGPFVYGIDELPTCVPAGVDTEDLWYVPGWSFVGQWDEDGQNFEFSCSDSHPVEGGSQSITVSGSVTYPVLP